MNKIPVVDDFGNKIGDFVPNGNGCGSGVFGAISLLLFSWVYMFTDISKRPKAWSEAINESFNKYLVLGLILLVDVSVFLFCSVILGLIWIFQIAGPVISTLGVIAVLGMYFTGLAGSILFLIFLILFFNSIRNKE